MISKILNLKNTNKLLFYVLLPIVGLAFLVNFLMKLNIIGAKNDLKNTKEEVLDLEKEKKEALDKATKILKEVESHKKAVKNHQTKADDARARAEAAESKTEDIDYDWHLKD